MEDINKPQTIEERSEDLLYHAMKGLDEMRGRTLIFNKFRDTQRISDSIYSLLKDIKKQRQTTDNGE